MRVLLRPLIRLSAVVAIAAGALFLTAESAKACINCVNCWDQVAGYHSACIEGTSANTFCEWYCVWDEQFQVWRVQDRDCYSPSGCSANCYC
jgi:hypothetical protein